MRVKACSVVLLKVQVFWNVALCLYLQDQVILQTVHLSNVTTMY
jgi:hypothetical protein